ncbi:hypothetical protein GS485_23085 [Rhodococcus hoagii]|nr:hypothetical protein [Prescottella equi]
MTGVLAAPLAQWEANGGKVPPLERQTVVKGDYRTSRGWIRSPTSASR